MLSYVASNDQYKCQSPGRANKSIQAQQSPFDERHAFCLLAHRLIATHNYFMNFLQKRSSSGSRRQLQQSLGLFARKSIETLCFLLFFSSKLASQLSSEQLLIRGKSYDVTSFSYSNCRIITIAVKLHDALATNAFNFSFGRVPLESEIDQSIDVQL